MTPDDWSQAEARVHIINQLVEVIQDKTIWMCRLKSDMDFDTNSLFRIRKLMKVIFYVVTDQLHSFLDAILLYGQEGERALIWEIKAGWDDHVDLFVGFRIFFRCTEWKPNPRYTKGLMPYLFTASILNSIARQLAHMGFSYFLLHFASPFLLLFTHTHSYWTFQPFDKCSSSPH